MAWSLSKGCQDRPVPNRNMRRSVSCKKVVNTHCSIGYSLGNWRVKQTSPLWQRTSPSLSAFFCLLREFSRIPGTCPHSELTTLATATPNPRPTYLLGKQTPLPFKKNWDEWTDPDISGGSIILIWLLLWLKRYWPWWLKYVEILPTWSNLQSQSGTIEP